MNLTFSERTQTRMHPNGNKVCWYKEKVGGTRYSVVVVTPDGNVVSSPLYYKRDMAVRRLQLAVESGW